MKKQTFMIIMLAVLLQGCFSTSNVPSKPKYYPKFDYTPPQSDTVSSAGVRIALINPTFIKKSDDNRSDIFDEKPFSTFIKNMGNDFEELLTAKGFTIRGPFASRDEMVYGDKKNSDIALGVDVSLDYDGETIYKRVPSYLAYQQGATRYRCGGEYVLSGKINIVATDPFSGEKFWKKSVSLPKKEIYCVGTSTWNGKPKLSQLIRQDDGFRIPFSKALEQYYKNALDKAWRHINVEEMKMIKREIEKAKNNK
jgi:hypothetical protein